MNGTSTQRAPLWFWIVALLGLAWNAMGVWAYLQYVYTNPSAMAAEQPMREAMPAWATGAFAIAVFAGLLGCIGLLIRKGWAKALLILSLLAVIAQQFWELVLSNTVQLSGSREMVLSVAVLLIAILLVWFASQASKKGWLS